MLFKQPVIPFKQQAEFLEKMIASLNEGFSITHSMILLSPFYMKEEFQQNLAELFSEGNDIASAFQFLGYSSAVIESVRLAEVHGLIHEVFIRTALQQRKHQELKKQAIATLSYPLGLLVFMAILFVAFRVYFLPMFIPLIERSNPQAVTQIHLIFSMPFYAVIFVMTLVIIISVMIISIKKSKTDKLLFQIRRISFVQKLQNGYTAFVISRELSLLLDGGLTIAQSLRFLVKGKSRLTYYAATDLLDHLERGESLSISTKLCSWISQDVVRYIEHGEIHGYVAKELQLYQEFTLELAQKRVQLTIAIAQPILFLIIGLMVISAYLSLMLPMYNLITI